MKNDILSRDDIEKIMHIFYEKIKKDETISFFFFEVVKVDWEKHTDQMCDFWENVLFYTGDYQGNPIETHKRINALHKTEDVHFRKWKELLFASADSLYEGQNVEKMKAHANAIAGVMLKKI